MFILTQYLLKTLLNKNLSKNSLQTYTIITGLVVYTMFYSYFLIYNTELLPYFNKIIIYIVGIDLLLTAFYNYCFNIELETFNTMPNSNGNVQLISDKQNDYSYDDNIIEDNSEEESEEDSEEESEEEDEIHNLQSEIDNETVDLQSENKNESNEDTLFIPNIEILSNYGNGDHVIPSIEFFDIPGNGNDVIPGTGDCVIPGSEKEMSQSLKKRGRPAKKTIPQESLS